MSGTTDRISAATRTLGTLALLALGGVLLLRCSARRLRAGPRQAGPEQIPAIGAASCRCRDLTQEASNRLGVIQGYCELAKMKGENGEALASRMDAAIETVTEVSALLRQLHAACRRQAP